MNKLEKERYYTFRPKYTGDSAETVKPQGKPSVLQKIFTNQ